MGSSGRKAAVSSPRLCSRWIHWQSWTSVLGRFGHAGPGGDRPAAPGIPRAPAGRRVGSSTPRRLHGYRRHLALPQPGRNGVQISREGPEAADVGRQSIPGTLEQRGPRPRWGGRRPISYAVAPTSMPAACGSSVSTKAVVAEADGDEGDLRRGMASSRIGLTHRGQGPRAPGLPG